RLPGSAPDGSLPPASFRAGAGMSAVRRDCGRGAAKEQDELRGQDRAALVTGSGEVVWAGRGERAPEPGWGSGARGGRPGGPARAGGTDWRQAWKEAPHSVPYPVHRDPRPDRTGDTRGADENRVGAAGKVGSSLRELQDASRGAGRLLTASASR